ncbi:3-hydroxyacyl-CoA dehydrogenase NAD-binding domain-containing protein [Variovorax guangxiensis]|uniref:3-hydroxyacyl-CoA dehydrogenase NAD-binding domain-containing protein n=1 Tax=Variovorax guangxiensis TaxID=1775474 RepID=UPI002856AA1E|nr:3-hydroxyacyl-CoA dehydrogenase NAD-binding domain-containing protein [Variovorax guangxiensis]MDR6860917.1 3-hydroxyacyl-CoA dehydrogenase [Variovorax guangxiensis]
MSEVQSVKYAVEDGVGVITIDNPPVNALGPGVREGIMQALANGNADPAVRSFVLIGTGRNFMAGADIRQFGGARPVSTRTSAAAIAASAKPVVAALHGYALGGGLEHALACHYRVAARNVRVGLPEVSLGIVPAGGGTQRLTRLIGPKAALEVIVSGRHVEASEALRLGILDEIVEDADLRAAAVQYALRAAEVRPLPSAQGDVLKPLPADELAALFEAARKSLSRKSRHLKAPLHALALVEAATSMSFDDGVALEQKLFEELENTDEAKALRYAFFAEREAAKIPGTSGLAQPEPVRSAAIVGGGTMGGGIAMAFADSGIEVKVLDMSQEALERGLKRIRDNYAVSVKRGSITQAQMDERLAKIRGVTDYAGIGDCDAVIEAVFERVELKQEVFAKLDEVMKPGALLLTNSSAIDIDVMAKATRRPEDVAGAHFFAPANVMKLCEVVRGSATRIQTIARTMKMARDLGKVGAVAGSCDGFAANRSRTPMMTEMMLMLEEGALPEQIDRIMVAFGYPMGPFAVNDMSGLDVSYEGRKRRAAADPEYRKLHIPDRMVEMGRRGQKTGAGWYRYAEGDRTPHPDDVVKQVIAEVANEFGIAQRTFSDDEILQRALFASVNEACRILEEGKAYRASDIDVMWLYGFGFPRHRGGLMYWADSVGTPAILAQVRQWHERYGKRWKPSALLERIAASGGRLRDAVPPQ